MRMRVRETSETPESREDATGEDAAGAEARTLREKWPSSYLEARSESLNELKISFNTTHLFMYAYFGQHFGQF